MSTLLSLQAPDESNEFDQVYPFETSDTISLYKKGSFYGLLRNGQVLTKPIYTPDVRIINDKYAVVRYFRNIPFYNNGVIIDIETGKELVTGFNAYFDHKNACIAFRVDGANSSKRWGIFSITEGKLIVEPIISPTYLHQYIDSCFLA